MAKAADEGRLRKLRKEAQRETKLAKKRLQQEQGSKQQPLQEAKSWASDEEEFRETLPKTDSGQGGRHPYLCLMNLHIY